MTNGLLNLTENMYKRTLNLGNRVSTYLQSGIVYHAASAIYGIGTSKYAISAVNNLSQGDFVGAIRDSAIVLIPIIYGQSLAADRYLEYRRIISDWQTNGYDEKAIPPYYLNWICHRNVLHRASRETGHEKEFKETLERHGIKWYYIVPRDPREWARAVISSTVKNPLIRRVSKNLLSKIVR